MKRQIFKQLQSWKHSNRRKPLILMGARQVGKTYALNQFGNSEYENMVYLNFENTPSLSRLFKQDLYPERLIKAIGIEKSTHIKPLTTLLIFDEVQECPEALNSLKYFNELANEYHIAAAGSLLGVKLMHTKGFPVGKVNVLHLYPLSFSEFLAAIGEEPLTEYLHEIIKPEPLPANIHDKLLNYFKEYLFIGGMPEAIAEYIKSENYALVRDVHKEILKTYNFDFSKHAPKNSVLKITQVWEAIPSQLAKENKKFIYSIIRKGARAKEFEEAIQWLYEAGLIHKVYNISTPKIPLDAYAQFQFFKIYLSDVGLLGTMTNLSEKAIVHGNELFQEFRGSLIENYIAQELKKNDDNLYYWTSEGKAEIDFLIQYDNNIYPIEIKAGNTKKKKSLKFYTDKYKPKLSVRSSPNNLKKDDIILNIPLYLIEKLSDFLR